MEHFPQPPVDPPDPPMECTWCQGFAVVAVATIVTADGTVKNTDAWHGNELEIPCPHCDGTGEEPAPDDPRTP